MHQRTPWRPCLAGILAALAVSIGPASAEVHRAGETIVAFPKTQVAPFGLAARYPDLAFDGAHDVYLVVSGQQPIEGRFVSGAGQPLGTPFRVSPSAGVIASRVDYSPAANAFVVTWLDEGGSGAADDAITARLVRYNGSGGPEFLSGEIFVGRNGVAKHTESAPSLACATASTECLITWAQWAAPWNVHAQRLDAASGALLGPEITVAATDHWEALPSVAYNSAQNEYFVVHTSESPGGVMYTVGERIQAGTGNHLGRSTLYGQAGLNNYPEVAYNSRGNLYMVVTWYFNPAPTGGDVYGMLVGGDGSAASGLIPVAANAFFEGGDGIGIAYNSYHDGFFAVFQGPSQDTLGVEMNGLGQPAAGVFRAMVSGAAKDIYQPQIAGASNMGRYLIAASVDHNRVSTQVLDTSTAGGPPPGGPNPPAPPPTSETIDLSPAAAPNGSWFFSEGAASANAGGFTTFYLIANENDSAVDVRAYFSRDDGFTTKQTLTIGPRSRATINLAGVAGQGAFGSVFQSTTPGLDIFVERSIYWGNFQGSTAEVAVKEPSPTWYFAEGSCGCQFYANFFLLYNPTQAAASVTATYARGDGQLVQRAYTVGPQGRLTVFANEVAELNGHNFGTTFSSSAPIVAERAMYWGQGWIGGTATIGAKAPSPQWLFAEGAASEGFDTFYLILNPSQTATRVNVQFSLPDGQVIPRFYDVAAGARANVWLNEVVGQVGAVSARFNTVGDIPIIVERSIYWAWTGNGWLEGTNSMGVNAGGAMWHVPEGSTTGAFEDFLMIHNAGGEAKEVVIQIFTESGQRETLIRTIPGLGRATLYMHSVLQELGLSTSQSFATRVYTSDGSAWLIVEHSLYFIRDGNYWQAGGSAFGIPR